MFQTREMSSVVLPGVRLSPSDNVHIPGQGTYVQHGYIYSSLVGELTTTTNPDNTVLVEVSGLAGDSLVPGAQDVVTVRQGFDLYLLKVTLSFLLLYLCV